MKSDMDNLFLCTQTFSYSEMMQLCNCFPHVSEMSTRTYKWVILTIFNLRGVVISIIFVLLKRADAYIL